MTAEQDFFRSVKDMEKRGRRDEAMGLLRDGLRRGRLEASGYERAGEMIRKAMARGDVAEKPVKILLLGQVTTSWLVPSLTAVAWGRNAAASVTEGNYDTILQDLAACEPGEGAPDVIALLPWNKRLFGGQGDTARRVADELAFWTRAWEEVTTRIGSRLIQVGYDWVIPGATGHNLGGRADGPVGLVSAMNRAIRENLPADAYFLDLEQVSGTVGRSGFYDMRRYHWTKQVFSEPGTVRVAEHLWAGVRAVTTGPKKVLVLDLDNTLWGGVVGEAGPLGVAVGDGAEGEAFHAFQAHAKELAARGVVLAIASKNNPADAHEAFETNPDMALRLDDFGALEICWDPKGTTIARLAKTLNLGLDSFVFFDDNPAEREQVRQALPEVEVVEVPEDPAEYVRALQAGLYFETTGLSQADRERAAQYAVERRRQTLEQSSASMEDYLRSLEMVGDARPIDEADLARVVQLLAKTNQFNLTTRRHTRQALQDMLAVPGSVGLTLRLRDRFGDHGLVAVLVAVPDGPAGILRVDTWLMSCRVIGRSAEHFLFGLLMGRAKALGHRGILGEYVPTKKNAQVAGFYETLGFRRSGDAGGDGQSLFELELEGAAPPESFVNPGRDES